MVQHALERGYEVVGVYREKSVGKLDDFKDRIPAPCRVRVMGNAPCIGNFMQPKALQQKGSRGFK